MRSDEDAVPLLRPYVGTSFRITSSVDADPVVTFNAGVAPRLISELFDLAEELLCLEVVIVG